MNQSLKTHIILLGPPAVGKLTVSRVLSDLTKYPVFDNAKTVDIALLLFNYNSKQYREYRDELRFSFYDKAVKSEIKGLISTYCLRRPGNWEYLKAVEKIFQTYNWQTVYFLLTAEKEVLIKRVESLDRRLKSSLSSRIQIEEWFRTSPLHSLTDGNKCIIVDTTNLNANEVANQVFSNISI